MTDANRWELRTELPRIPARKQDGHKGNYGRVLVLAGSRGMAGAAVLAGTAALRSGAGLVTVACPIEVQATVASGFPCYTTCGLPCTPEGQLHEDAVSKVEALAENFDVVATGPGLGRSTGVLKTIQALLRMKELTLVLDADALNALAADSASDKPASPTILTPHPGEFRRLTGYSTSSIQSQRIELAVECARKRGVVLLLKGQKTVVTDGQRVYVNSTGNPGMATGGSGDVLTGVIAAIVGQGLSPFDATQLGSWIHGRAGDLAAETLGEISLTARDLLDYLPRAFREVTDVRSSRE